MRRRGRCDSVAGAGAGGAVVLSPAAARRVRDGWSCGPFGGGAMEVRGEAAPDAARASRSPFVGRAAELALLAERYRRAAAGRGQVVLLVGEPASGSRASSTSCGASRGEDAERAATTFRCSPDHTSRLSSRSRPCARGSRAVARDRTGVRAAARGGRAPRDAVGARRCRSCGAAGRGVARGAAPPPARRGHRRAARGRRATPPCSSSKTFTGPTRRRSSCSNAWSGSWRRSRSSSS